MGRIVCRVGRMAAEVPHYEVFWNLNSHGLADFAEDSGLRTYPISPEIVDLYTGLDWTDRHPTLIALEEIKG